MSIDHDAHAVLGFVLSREELMDVLGVDLPEEAHLEDRFDPRTGAPLPQERVVDFEAGRYMRLGENIYSDLDLEELGEALADLIGGCTAWVVGDFVGGEFMSICFEPEHKGELTVDAVVSLASELKRIQRALHEMGFAVCEQPCVQAVLSIC